MLAFYLTLQRLIEEERQKRKLIDRDNQHLRRHSDFNPVKSPIITNDRFNDLLGEPPKVAEKPIPKWKQEVSNKVAMETELFAGTMCCFFYRFCAA